MFYLSRKKSACLAGIMMLSGAAAAADTTPAVTPDPVTPAIEKSAPAPAAPAVEKPAEVATPVAVAPAVEKPTEAATPAAAAPAVEKPAEVATPVAVAPAVEKPAEAATPAAAALAVEKPAEVATPAAAAPVVEKPAEVATPVAAAPAVETAVVAATPDAAAPAVEAPAVAATPDASAPAVEKPAPATSTDTATPGMEKPVAAVTGTTAPLSTLPTSAANVPAAPAAKKEPKASEKPAFSLNSEEQKRAYASGVAMARYIEEQIEQQKTLHITMSKEIMLVGIADTFNNQVKMSNQDIQATLTAFDEQVKVLTKAEMDKKSAADEAFLASFAKQDGVKKTKQGLLYLVKNKGEGNALKDTDRVEVGYQGKLVDGTIVDGPQIDNANQIFRVANMPPVLRDSVKLIRKGGEVQVVIPPGHVESANSDNKPDVVVIYTITVVDVNKAQ